ncbi:MAG: PEP-CTERM sorting domain-containing protein [Chthonomonas sp.]|nr:PEP-CTERM sorting domain-containing protein [Chthonomonas sp.]
MARSTGVDLNAAVGSEIPTHVSLNVPIVGNFRVRIAVQNMGSSYGEVFLSTLTSYIAYDRAEVTNVAYLGAIPSDTYSFRKLSPAFTAEESLAANLSRFASDPVFDRQKRPLDENSDGVQDLANYVVVSSRGIGAYVAGSDDLRQLRPIGLSHSVWPRYLTRNGNFGFGWLKVLPGEKHVICDQSFTTSLGIGETYGTHSGETGLLVHTSGGEKTPNGNDHGYYRSSLMHPEPWQHIGAKYTLIGAAPVPEPGVMVGLLAGLGMLIRRRR